MISHLPGATGARQLALFPATTGLALRAGGAARKGIAGKNCGLGDIGPDACRWLSAAAIMVAPAVALGRCDGTSRA